MPTARPIIVIMFVTKKDSWYTCPTRLVSASETTMAATARPIGSSAETRLPNTISSTIRATGMPIDSPVERSEPAVVFVSRAIAAWPVTCACRPADDASVASAITLLTESVAVVSEPAITTPSSTVLPSRLISFVPPPFQGVTAESTTAGPSPSIRAASASTAARDGGPPCVDWITTVSVS